MASAHPYPVKLPVELDAHGIRKSSHKGITRSLCFILMRSLLFDETVGSERFWENPGIRIAMDYKNKNWEFTALRCEFPILAGAQGLELPLLIAFINFC